MPVVLAVLALFTLVACEEGGGGGVEGEGEGEGEPLPLDDDQVRLGTALNNDDGAPVVDEGSLAVPPDEAGPNGLPAVSLFDLGNLDVDVDGYTGTVLWDVDARVTGVTFVVYGTDTVMVMRAEDGGGGVVIDDRVVPPETPAFEQVNALSTGFPAQFLSPGRVLPARGAGAFAIPSTTDVPMSAGTWSARFGHFVVSFDADGNPTTTPVPTPVRVLALVRTAPVVAGSIKLALHFSGAQGLTADQAEVSASFNDALDLLRDSWSAVGVDASDVEFVDMADGAAFQTIVLDEPRCDGGDMDALVKKGRPGRLNLFFVERFECGPFGPFLLGMSPGIPGVPFATGTARSGIVVAGSFLASNPADFAVVMAHEAAHFVGLFHTQENDRFGDDDVYDNIADTGESPASRANLMYFDVSRISEQTLTAGQGKTMQANPAVQP